MPSITLNNIDRWRSSPFRSNKMSAEVSIRRDALHMHAFCTWCHFATFVLTQLPPFFRSAQFISYLNLAPYSSAQRGTFNNDGLLSIVEQNPGLCSTKHEFTFASGAVPPIFMAVSLGANKKLVSALADACPAALGQTDRYGRTPLHQAVEFGSTADVVEYLLTVRPQSAAATDHIGRTPLHCACAYSASIDIVRLL